MPLNRNQERRLRKLNELLRSPRGYTKEELITLVGDYIRDYRKTSDTVISGPGISKRTIEADLAYLRDEKGAVIIFPNGRFKYENPNFNAFGAELDPESITTIKAASSLLKSIPGFELYNELKPIIKQLEMRAEDEDSERKILAFDNRPGFTGNKYLSVLFEHIQGENVISFNYQPFKAEKEMSVIMHPYLLKEYNNRWFLIGLSETARKENRYEISVYGLDRIKGKIKPVASIGYYYHIKFDPDLFHKDIIGVSLPKDGKLEKILLRFDKPRAYYVLNNPLHHSQVIEKECDDRIDFSFRLIPNLELEALILSFGKDVKVLDPVNLRLIIENRLNAALNRYT